MLCDGRDEERRLGKHWHDKLGKQQVGVARREIGFASV
jgi:hypothetical protein